MKQRIALHPLILAGFLVITGCAAKKHPFMGPGHDADWPIEAPDAPAYEAFLKANIESQRGMVEDSIESFETTLKHDPTCAPALNGLAFELMRKGDFVRAEEMARKAIGLKSDARDAYILLGKIHSARQDWKAAEEEFKKVIELDPEKEEEGVVALASVYMDSKRPEEAAALLEKFVERKTDSMYGYYYLGRVYSELNRTDDALKAYEKSLAINPGFTSALKAVGLIYEYQGKKKEAIEAFENILDIQPDNTGVRNHLAQLYLDEKNYDRAQKQLEIVVEEQPENFTARLRLGLLYMQHEDLAKSEQTLRKLLSDVPQKDRVHYYLGVVLEKKGDRKAALKEFEEVDSGSDNYIDARLAASYLYDQQNDLKSAEEILRAGLKKFPDSNQLLAALSNVLSKLDRSAEAKAMLETAIAKSQKDEMLWFALGEVCDKMKDLRGLDQSMRKVLEINPDNASALNYLGYSYAERGINLEEAEKFIRRALEIKPKDGYITDSLGWIYFKRRQFDQAVKTLEQATQLSPDEPVILEHFADALIQTGNSTRAKEIYEKANGLTKDESDKKRIQEKLKNMSAP